jgi:MFS family permease
VAQNNQTLLVSRFFNGVCGSVFMSVAGGTVGDLFSGNDLGVRMMLYTAAPFVGPELGVALSTRTPLGDGLTTPC